MAKFLEKLKRHPAEALTAAFFLLLVLLGAVNVVQRGPDYDELWTLEHFVPQSVTRILTDVATPNNHVWNTLGIKLVFQATGFSLAAARLPALTGYFLLGILVFYAAFRLLRSVPARVLFPAAVLCDGYLRYYAETARGYSWQCACVLGMVLALTHLADHPQSRRAAGAWLLCATVGSLAVSSGVLYAFALTSAWVLLAKPLTGTSAERFRRFRTLFAAGAVYTLFVLLWYGLQFQKFAKGRAEFGTALDHAAAIAGFFRAALWETDLVWYLPVVLAGVVFCRKTPAGKFALWLAASFAIMLAAGFAAHGGPARVYLGWIAPMALAAAMTVDEPLSRHALPKAAERLLPVLIVLAAALYSQHRKNLITPPDFAQLFGEIQRSVPTSTLILWPAGDTYILHKLFPEEAPRDHADRLRNFQQVMVLHGPRITMIAQDTFATVETDSGARPLHSGTFSARTTYHIYPVRELRDDDDLTGRLVLCRAAGRPAALRPGGMLRGRFAVLNSCIAAPPSGYPPLVLLGAYSPDLSAAELRRIEKDSQNLILFRLLGE